jgi:hypothetical protein
LGAPNETYAEKAAREKKNKERPSAVAMLYIKGKPRNVTRLGLWGTIDSAWLRRPKISIGLKTRGIGVSAGNTRSD